MKTYITDTSHWHSSVVFRFTRRIEPPTMTQLICRTVFISAIKVSHNSQTISVNACINLNIIQHRYWEIKGSLSVLVNYSILILSPQDVLFSTTFQPPFQYKYLVVLSIPVPFSFLYATLPFNESLSILYSPRTSGLGTSSSLGDAIRTTLHSTILIFDNIL